MKKLIFCFSLVCAGLLTSCVDKNELVDEDSKPSWLGESIYGELRNPDASKGLTGTFNYYLRLVDDLGYAETLSRTGSKTVFPANDEAFENFFASREWPGVSKYDDLSDAQKKMLLYSSMLDNAILVEMLSNVSSGDGVVSGNALKHNTSLSTIDSVTTYPFLSALAAYGERNPFWTRFSNGISLVSDATTPMLVHFTRDYMLKNTITTVGDNSDFAIITGGSYDSEKKDAYVFDKKIVARDVTCQNGYIHQVDGVITPPGNMAQVVKRDANMTIFNHMLDRFAMPVYNNKVTNLYHDWFVEQEKIKDMTGVYNPDSIFEVRYLSKLSQDNAKFSGDAKSGGVFLDENLLSLDPGWNGYYVKPVNSSSPAAELADLAVMFVPDDEAMTEYLTNGAGSILLSTYGQLPNTAENIMRNIEDVPRNILSKLISNMMNSSFAASVPSKFTSIVDDAKDVMGITLADVKQDNGKYDVRIANNGVVYVMNKVFGPKAYEVVSAPALFGTGKGMSMVNWIIQNVSYNNVYGLNLDYYAYLLSTSSNYALFLPTDEAFDAWYVDPASLKRSTGAEAIHYYYVGEGSKSGIAASRWKYDAATHTVSDSIDVLDFSAGSNSTGMLTVRSQLSEIIQLGTVVLPSGETLQPGNFYKTKNGAGLKVSGSGTLLNGHVYGGGQIVDGIAPANITNVYNQTNGKSYSVNSLIQGTTRSVYSMLSSTPRFSEFFELCNGFDNDVMKWAGISTEKVTGGTGIIESDQYKTFFTPGENTTSSSTQLRCMDFNIKFFSNYNYTLYAPNNDAMAAAISHGLPTWEKINEIYMRYQGEDDAVEGEDEAKAEVKTMIKAIRDFIRYHFHNTSVYASPNISTVSSDYSTFLVDDDKHISKLINVKGGDNGKILITDEKDVKTIDPANSSLLVNEMTRDMEFDQNRNSAQYVTASSYAVVHELTAPLSYNSDMDYSKGLVSN